MVLFATPSATAADDEDLGIDAYFGVVTPAENGKPRYVDCNEPIRRMERQRNAAALATVRGDERFEKFFSVARYVPEHRRIHSVRSSIAGRGYFRLSAEQTDLQQAKELLTDLAGPTAVKQLELDLFPALNGQPWPDK
jgi:hypothetical protein